MPYARSPEESWDRCQDSEKYSRILDFAPVFVRSPKDEIIYWNQGTQAMYGFSREEALGRISHELLQTRFPEPLERIREKLQAGQRWRGELRHIRRGGESIFVSSEWIPYAGSTGALEAVVEISKDITEFKVAEQDQARLAAIVRSSEDAIVSKDLHGIVTTWNKAAERLFGFRADEVIGLPITLIIPEARRAEEVAILERLQRGESIERYETVRITKAGQPLDVSLTISPVLDKTGRIIGAAKIAHDITHRKRSALALKETQAKLKAHSENLERMVADRTAQLLEANANLQTFAYTAAHDLRTPLRAIGSFSKIVLDEGGTGIYPEGRAMIGRVIEAAGQMQKLLDDLLEYSKMSQAELTLGPISLDQVTNDALTLLEAEINAKHAHVTVARPLPEVTGHLATLVMLVSNLVSNALKFVAPDVEPQVRIWTEEITEVEAPRNPPAPATGEIHEMEPEQSADVAGFALPRPSLGLPLIRLYVQDNGIGIAERYQQKIFEVFQRLHGKGSFPGTGLGLAIVRKGAERLRGRVGVQSEPGKGSRFWIDLSKARLDNL